MHKELEVYGKPVTPSITIPLDSFHPFRYKQAVYRSFIDRNETVTTTEEVKTKEHQNSPDSLKWDLTKKILPRLKEKLKRKAMTSTTCKQSLQQ